MYSADFFNYSIFYWVNESLSGSALIYA